MVKDTRWCWGKSIVLSEDGRNCYDRNCYDRNFNFHEDVLPASIEISVELRQEVPQLSLVVELDNQLGPHVTDHLQHVRYLV